MFIQGYAMAGIPPLHVCHTLTSQNEQLTQKYNNLKRSYKKLLKETVELKENLMRVQMEKEYATRAGLQRPNTVTVVEGEPVVTKNIVNTTKDVTTEKLLKLNSQLLKQVEKGNKQMKNSEKKLVKFDNEKEKLQSDLFEANQQITALRKQVTDKEEQYQSLCGKLKAVGRSKKDVMTTVTSMKREREKLATENVRLKGELKGIDGKFFEEIEDMKYALQQSAKLNVEYEKALRRLCKQFGLNYNSALFPT